MFGGAAGYAVMTLPTQQFYNPQQHNEKAVAFGKQQHPQQEQQVPLVDVSLDLMQYMSDSFAAYGWVVPTMTNQQPHAGANTKAGSLAACSSLMGSSCSTHSNQMVPDSPACSNSSQQQPQQQDGDMRGSSCGSDTMAAAAPTSSSGSGSGSSSHMMAQCAGSHPLPAAAAAGSCLSYNDDFVFQCYYGNPNSPANQQQQRPKQHSPFAAYASFAGFSL